MSILEDKNSDNTGNWTTNPPSYRKTASGQRGYNCNIGLVFSDGAPVAYIGESSTCVKYLTTLNVHSSFM